MDEARAQSLAAECRRALRLHENKPSIVIFFPKGERKPKGVPRGEKLCVNPMGGRVFRMRADEAVRSQDNFLHIGPMWRKLY